jgi:hypothetical protein
LCTRCYVDRFSTVQTDFCHGGLTLLLPNIICIECHVAMKARLCVMGSCSWSRNQLDMTILPAGAEAFSIGERVELVFCVTGG